MAGRRRKVVVPMLACLEPLDWQIRNGTVESGVTLSKTIRGRAERRRPIDLLLSREHLTDRQWYAADRLARDFALGPCGGRDVDDGENVPGIRGAGGIQGYAVAQLDSTRAYQMAVRFLGLIRSAVVLPIVCEEIGLRELARRMGRRDEGVRAAFRESLDSLAGYYGE